jgi:hypothetical protein
MHTLRYLSGIKEAGIIYRHDGNKKHVTLAGADSGSDETRRICAAFLEMLAVGLLLWAVTLVTYKGLWSLVGSSLSRSNKAESAFS